MPPLAFMERPYRWLEAITKYRATISGGPNFAYELCMARISDDQLAALDLSSWRVAFSGAEPIRMQTLERFAERFAPCGFKADAFLPLYGLAEATLIVSGRREAVSDVQEASRAPQAGRASNRLRLPRRPPVTCYFADGRHCNQRLVETTASSPHVRPLIGCGHSMRGQQIAIVDPETLQRLSEGEIGEVGFRGRASHVDIGTVGNRRNGPFMHSFADPPKPRGLCGTVPENRGPGLPPPRRIIHHRSQEGSDYRPRPQLLSAGHRAHRRAPPSGDCLWRCGRLSGRSGRRRARLGGRRSGPARESRLPGAFPDVAICNLRGARIASAYDSGRQAIANSENLQRQIATIRLPPNVRSGTIDGLLARAAPMATAPGLQAMRRTTRKSRMHGRPGIMTMPREQLAIRGWRVARQHPTMAAHSWGPTCRLRMLPGRHRQVLPLKAWTVLLPFRTQPFRQGDHAGGCD